MVGDIDCRIAVSINAWILWLGGSDTPEAHRDIHDGMIPVVQSW